MQKVPHLEGLSSNYSKLFRVVYKGSLSHAKMLEDVAENFVGCDLTAGDFGKDIEDLAEVFSKEVATKVDVHAFYNAQETFVGAKEGVVVAD